MNNCKGCASIREGACRCGYEEDNEDGDCPCTECIVKPMCDAPCPPWDAWVRKLVTR